MESFNPKRALISVSNKEGLIDLAKILHQNDVEIIATGNTALTLKSAEIPVVEVSEYTGFEELLDGRVKTLNPRIHAGLLARGVQDEATLAKHNILPIDLLVVNLYPFEQVVSHSDCQFQEAVENIDIGGPAMIRSAAKNHESVLVIVATDDYDELMTAVAKKEIRKEWRFELAKKAFAHTAGYDSVISNYFGTLNQEKKPENFPAIFNCQFHKKYDLRYGENPHQQAIFYTDKNPVAGSIAEAKLLQGKMLSYNNLLDANAAYECILDFPKEIPCCVIVKHGNPCGIASTATVINAYQRAYQTDPSSSYGGIIAFNQSLDKDTAAAILKNQFVEIIIAPDLSAQAQEVLKTKPNIRVLEVNPSTRSEQLDLRRISGGLLVQEQDRLTLTKSNFSLVSERQCSTREQEDLLFAWQAVKHVKSNAMVLVKDRATIGIGAGQTSRVMSTRIALWQAKEYGFDTRFSVLASDAFIPFTDSLELAVKAGVTAIIQPGGSIKDKEIIEYANAAGLSMIFTGTRHFRH